MKILFDVDGTLIRWNGDADKDQPISEMVNLLITLARAGHDVYVASSGGERYAAAWCSRLMIRDLVTIVPKFGREPVDIAFDDLELDLGTVNCRVRMA